VRKLIARGDWEAIETLREAGDENLPPAQGMLWLAVQANPAFDGLVASLGDTFSNMFVNSPKQFESVLQIANRNTEFVDSPAMQRCLEASDFSLSDLKASPRGMSLYLSLPQRYMGTHYRWLRMMIALTVTEMEIVRKRPATGYPVLLLLDEFAGLKRMEVIENAVAQIAGFGVKLFLVLQSLEQQGDLQGKLGDVSRELRIESVLQSRGSLLTGVCLQTDRRNGSDQAGAFNEREPVGFGKPFGERLALALREQRALFLARDLRVGRHQQVGFKL
jgi:hypothetical protein